MILDPAIAVADDLFVFRCLVTVIFDEPRVMEDVGEVDVYSRLYGITAPSYTAAVQILEKFAGRGMTEEGEPEGQTDGWLEEIEVAVMDPEDVSADAVPKKMLKEPGIHFVSEPMFFDEDGDQLVG